MNLTDVIIVLLVMILAAIAGYVSWKKKDSCADCPSAAGGSCSSNRGNCPSHAKSAGGSLVERYRRDHPKN